MSRYSGSTTSHYRRTPGSSNRALRAILAVALVSSACGGGEAGGLIVIDGSSTVFPITEVVAEEFMVATNGRVYVVVGVSGTGGGFQRFCMEETDINNSSRTISPYERELCADNRVSGIEIPIALDGIAVVVHPENDFVSCLTTDELLRIWGPNSRVLQWRDVRPEWPAEPIRLYGPGTESGTFDFFTEAIAGEPGASRTNYMASEDDFILVEGVAGDRNALGYVGYVYYLDNQDRLKLVAVDAGRGCIAPSPETIANERYSPLSRTLFLHVNDEALRRRPEVLEFLRFYMERAQEVVPFVGFVPLGADQYAVNINRIERAAGVRR